jgi:hypothetical protein
MEIAQGIKGRKRGEVLPFSRFPVTGEIRELPDNIKRYTCYSNGTAKPGQMHVFCPYIPLPYACSFVGDSISSLHPVIIQQLLSGQKQEMWAKKKEQIGNNHLAGLLYNIWNRCSGDDFKYYLQDKIEDDINEALSLSDTLQLESGSVHYSKENVTNRFCSRAHYNSYLLDHFSFKTYRGKVGVYSIWINDEPTIIPIIRAEDWAYQRLHMLVHNKPDLSRVIILMDNRLDGDFPVPNFKYYYREQLEPELRKLVCPIFKVPLDFIKENCFLQQFQLKERNIIRRKQKVEELIEDFYQTHFPQF